MSLASISTRRSRATHVSSALPSRTADMTEDWVDLYNTKDIILSPFHDLAATHPRFDLVWTIENREENDTRYVLCHRRQETTPRGRQPYIPLLFDMIGEVSRDNFYMTGYGTIGQPGAEVQEAPMASCWLQPRSTHALSRINWRTLPFSLRTITDCIPAFDVNTEDMFRTNDDDVPQLKLKWQGFPGETTATALPLYNAVGSRCIPMSLEQFPFGEAFHAAFTVDLYHNREMENPYSVVANLIHMARA